MPHPLATLNKFDDDDALTADFMGSTVAILDDHLEVNLVIKVLGYSPGTVLGFFLASIPLSWRSALLKQFRRFKSKDYTEEARQTN